MNIQLYFIQIEEFVEWKGVCDYHSAENKKPLLNKNSE